MSRAFHEALSRYLALLNRLDEPNGDWRKGELQIIRTRDDVERHIVELSEFVGIVYEDQYVYLLRDGVLFPPKPGETEPRLGTYIRVVYKNRANGNPGIFLLTVDTERRLVLNRIFRHATRSWMLEGQGTIALSGESREGSVARCVQQEIGRPLLNTALLCEDFVSEHGLVGDAVPMLLATVGGEPADRVEDPIVAGHVALDADAYEAALLTGTYDIDGIPHRLRDGYTMSAFLLAKLRKLL